MAEIVVLLEVFPTPEGRKKYLDMAGMLRPLLTGFEGFIRAERFQSLSREGKLLSVNVWTDEEAVTRWRNLMPHRMSQREGYVRLFKSYSITVCQTLRSYTGTERAEAPVDSNEYMWGELL